MADVTFRRATVEDAAAVAALVNSAYRGESSKQGWTTEADLLDGTRAVENEIHTLVATDHTMTILCVDGNEIVGSVNIEKQGELCYLSMLAVRPGKQGGGIGRQLMQEAERQARETWASKKMTMTVITMRPELIAYYERRGYRRTGELKPFLFDDVHAIPRVDGIELEILEKDLV